MNQQANKLINYRVLPKSTNWWTKEDKLQAQKGFTLIEILLGMAIFIALGATLVALQSLLTQGEGFSVSTLYTVENANASLQTLVNELRNAHQSETGAFPLEEATSDQVIFYTNTDNDPETERIRYFFTEGELRKGIIEPTGFPVSYPQENEKVKTVAQFIQPSSQPFFTYYNQGWPTDQTNNPLSSPAPVGEVTLVKISTRINATPARPEGEMTLESAVQIRSLKTNL